MVKAFSEEGTTRTFEGNVDPQSLQWHRDEEDREVLVVQGSGWYYQRDNELPVPLTPGVTLNIPEGCWHRLYREGAASDLVVQVKKVYNEVEHEGEGK